MKIRLIEPMFLLYNDFVTRKTKVVNLKHKTLLISQRYLIVLINRNSSYITLKPTVSNNCIVLLPWHSVIPLNTFIFILRMKFILFIILNA